MKKSLSIFLATMFLLLSFETASACLCFSLPDPTPEQIRTQLNGELIKANLVFSGEVIRLDDFKVAFRVEKAWKGKTVKEINMSTGAINNNDGTVIRTSCDYSFEMGKKYLVYATGSGKKMKTSECTGTGQLKFSDDRIKFLQEIKLQKEKVVRSTKKKN